MKETFGQRFSRIRKKLNYTQDDIAQKLNITAQAISKWENDISLPDISMLNDIANLFNISIDELLGRDILKTKQLVKEERKNINSMILSIRIISSDGDTISVNLPVSIVLACIKAGTSLPQVSSKVDMSAIDFNLIIELIEQGVVGKLIDIKSADGDIVEICVE